MEQKQCPVCSSPMEYNKEGLERNAKAPQYKCTNKSCKMKWNKWKKTWEPSEYITGTWGDEPEMDKDDRPANSIESAMDKKDAMIRGSQERKENGIDKSRSISGAYHIVSSMIQAGMIKDEQQIKDKLKEYTAYLFSIDIDKNTKAVIAEDVFGNDLPF